MTDAGARPRINIAMASGVLSKLERYAASRGSKPAVEATYLLTTALDNLDREGLIPPPSPDADTDKSLQQLEVLKGFLNVLLETHGKDGYSLAEIAEILERDSDRELLDLFKRLRRGNGDKNPNKERV